MAASSLVYFHPRLSNTKNILIESWNDRSPSHKHLEKQAVDGVLGGALSLSLSHPILRRWYIRRGIAQGAFLYPLVGALTLLGGKITYAYVGPGARHAWHSALLARDHGIVEDLMQGQK
jgi:hypothetical protein